ncbi:MAG: hypothetical protein HKP58_15710 [Desulfatitalea sp.]|nr:hypothetical protein [Desulfatitalea sp.]NNK01857.1 hypothetical protein [Desulfatitalea sp.]
MTKISQIIEASKRIEQNKTGFTVPDVMDELGWSSPDEKFYIQNALSSLARKGKATKLSTTKPIVYSLKSGSGTGTSALSAHTEKHKAPKVNSSVSFLNLDESDTAEEKKHFPAPESLQHSSPESLVEMGVSLEMIGKAVFRHQRTLQRKIFDLEDELAKVKRMLDEANKRIREQTLQIEKQNQLIAGSNNDQRGAYPFKRKVHHGR